MKANMFFLGTLLRTAFDSGKKQEQAISQQAIRVIDYDTRLPIVDVNISCVRDDYYETPLRRTLLPFTHQILQTAEIGVVTYNFMDGGYLTIEAAGYLQRNVSMRHAKGDVEMLKSALIEVEILDENISAETITRMDVNREDDLEFPVSIRETFNLAYKSISNPTGNYTVYFDGLANRQNNIRLTFFSGSIRCTSISIIPIPGKLNKVQFKY